MGFICRGVVNYVQRRVGEPNAVARSSHPAAPRPHLQPAFRWRPPPRSFLLISIDVVISGFSGPCFVLEIMCLDGYHLVSVSLLPDPKSAVLGWLDPLIIQVVFCVDTCCASVPAAQPRVLALRSPATSPNC
jgi:hypothetical protein